MSLQANQVIRILAVSLLAALLATPVYSQAERGTITGIVADESNAAVPGAKVTITRIDTGFNSIATADAQGNFVAPGLLPGQYRVEAEHPGFSKTTIEPLELHVDERLTVNPILKVGAVTEAVKVTSQGSLVETASSEIGQVVGTRQIVELPLNGRNFLQLGLLSPGTTTGLPPGGAGDLGGQGSISISGGRLQSNEFTLDGLYNSDTNFGALNVALSVDAIAEFRIQRNTYSAESGFATGQVSVISKSGTNAFHGSLYEFLRNDALDARMAFDAAKPPYRQNQFGATFGGPIYHDKTFFFMSYEGFRATQTITLIGTLPSAQELAGNFSGMAPVIDPATGQPYPGNQIPASDFSPLSQRILKYLPAPAAGGANNFANSEATTNDFDQISFRVDHRFSAKDAIFGRYSHYTDLNSYIPAVVPQTGLSTVAGPHNGTFQYTHVFNPNLLNEARFGVSRAFAGTLQSGASGPNILQFQNVSTNSENNGLPIIQLVGFSLIGGPGNGIAVPAIRGSTTYEISDALTWVKGKHSVKFGGGYKDIQNPIQEGLFSRGQFIFAGIFGNPVADFLLGYPAAAIGAGNIATAYLSWHASDFYVQDDWKILPNLTLNFGMRYDRIGALKDRYRGRVGIFDPRTGQVVGSSDVEKDGLVNPDNIGFQPRFGFAWQPFSNSKTVVRGGYGVYNDFRPFNERLFSLGTELSYQLVPFGPKWDTLFPKAPALGVGILTDDPFARDPYVQMYSLGIQRELPFDSVLEVYYAGSVGHKLDTRIDINQATLPPDPANPSPLATRRPYPDLGSILMSKDIANSNYNALQVRFEKRYSHNLLFTAAYTYSKSLDTASSTCDASSCNSGQDNYNLSAEYGPSSFNQKHRFVVSPIYQLPFGRGQMFLNNLPRPVDLLVRGWQVTAITTFASGLPFTAAVVGVDRTETGTFGGGVQRANCNGQPGNLPSGDRTTTHDFNTAAFSLAPLGTYGNCGRDNLTSRGFDNWDISFIKDTPITERTTLQFRSEFFNAFNRPQFYAPVSDPTSPAFGQIISVGPAREIQFALKLLF